MLVKTIQWLKRERSSSRLALVLQLGSRVGSSGLALVWSRLLQGAMGSSLYGGYLSFLKLASLGGLGDLGMGGAVNYRLAQYLGQGKEREAVRFLASARGLFLLLGLAMGAGFALGAPILNLGLRFDNVPGLGSTGALFGMAAVAVMVSIFSSYSANVNYACGNLVWPVIPGFLLAQMGLAAHWLLARQGFPLWVQYSPYVLVAIITLLLTRLWVRESHPQFAAWLPLELDTRTGLALFESSFWVYLCSLGNKIYTSTDSLLVLKSFGADQVPMYEFNYRACELSLFVVTTAAFVAFPKIARLLASPTPGDRERAQAEAQKLNQFQSFFGCFAALGYLALNSLFMYVWMGHAKEPVPAASILLQTAFAMNLAVTACGDSAIQITGRTGPAGLRMMGMAVGATGLLNLGLSLIAAHYQFMAGIAFATVLSQAVLTLITAWYVCRYFRAPLGNWVARSILAPLVLVGIAGWLRSFLVLNSVGSVAVLVVGYAGILLVLARILGITPAIIQAEVAMLRAMVKGK